ncbi:glutathione S-transferase family protein [Enterovirga rhinocerotis]|uniref:GST-like protein n=1 Tax=Enterovirga rhinocerotis TaxID=1339210 RepID=A0A4R7BV78_9HYPH|nr:glutathione S-transferase N-terminal domain-containing protein [Enterovirga rhinocerotis]TDR89313.1 GST-like protein [Enterovirga rhinocerotis]
MMKLYFNLSPNPMKVVLALEEMDLAYEPAVVDTRKGAQFRPDYLALNPNAKVPALVDGDAVVFDSNAILLYLAQKTGRFSPAAGDKAQGEFLSWLMFVATGIGPFSGQAVHFRHFAPEQVPYAHRRYQYEAERHYRVLDERLSGREFIAGDAYTIVDMAAWGWARMVPFVLGEDAWAKFPNVKRHLDAISARPAAARVEALRGQFASAFKADMDDEARGYMFKHLTA